MKSLKAYYGLSVTGLILQPEQGFLAGSKDDVVNEENTEVVIDEQIGGGDILIDGWD